MGRTGLLLIATLSLAAAGPADAAASAQLPVPRAQPQAEEEILVTGTPLAREAVRSFVDSVTVEADGQIAKFATPVCPLALGLPHGHGEVIAARLRQVAEHIGLGAAPNGCDPNVVVIVADSGGELMRRLRRERPTLFSMFDLSDIRELMRLDGPVRAWQLVEPRGADGRPMERIAFLATGPNDPPRPIARGYMLPGVMPSITQTPTRQDLAVSFVILDLDAIEGLTLLQIADHSAMRALARTDPTALPPGRSILTLFRDRDAAAAIELTEWDVAYLASLYRTMHNVTAQRHRSSIARMMGRELGVAPRGRADPPRP